MSNHSAHMYICGDQAEGKAWSHHKDCCEVFCDEDSEVEESFRVCACQNALSFKQPPAFPYLLVPWASMAKAWHNPVDMKLNKTAENRKALNPIIS